MERLRRECQIDIRITHFPLHPNTPEEGLTLEELFAGRNVNVSASQERMAKRMLQEGLAYGDRTMTYNSRLAQELATWAESRRDNREIHNALFQAYFVRGINLARVDELVRIAGQVGLSKEEAKEVLENRRFHNAVNVDWQRSHALGVTGVPTFIVENQRVAGAQPYEVLKKLVLGAEPQSVSNSE